MQDSFKREINYLRVSVTDRCNLRCKYCMPVEGIEPMEHQQILSLEEIQRIIKVSVNLGIKKVRLTGGEPLVRKNLTQLVHYISGIPQIDDIALTTNGILFPQMAAALKDAGLNRVNISLDSLVPEKYSYITRGGSLARVKEAITKALQLDFRPVKLNVVMIRGFNDDELLDFAQMAYDYPLNIRFIEFMPVGDLLYWDKQKMISADEMRAQIETRYTLEPGRKVRGNGPARYFDIHGGQGSIGFINPISNHFCRECNRIRLTAEGKIRACLYDLHETDLKEAIMNGAKDDEIQQILKKAIEEKPERHHMNDGWGNANKRKMVQIGG